MLTRFAAIGIRSTLIFCTAIDPFGQSHLRAQEKDGAGAVISGKATAKDVGLPLYPGSIPHKDKDQDRSGANLGLWGGGAGFKLVVLKMESTDSPEKVAAFYRKALSRYGTVLDCSNPPAHSTNTDKDDSSKVLTCDDDKAEKGGYVYKVGTKDKHHLVAIDPAAKGSVYNLIRIGAWSSK